jgi:hypothetical protein
LSVDKKPGKRSDKSMASVFSKMGTLLIVLAIAGLLGNTPATAMTPDSMSAEAADCQNCGEAGNMQNTGALCSSVCVVSVAVDKTAIDTTTLLGAQKNQFEIQNSRLHERSEYPEPHPPKHTS